MDTTRSPDTDDPNKPKKPEDLNAPIFDIREVAYLLKCSVKTVRRRIAMGAPHSRGGPRSPIKVSREDLDYYYDMDRIGPRRPAPRKRMKSAA